MQTKIQCLFLVLSIIFPFHAFAGTIAVEASHPSGVYHQPLTLELRASESRAKIFYTFKPGGSPQDALIYTGAILLKKSTPVLFFSFFDHENESKIMQYDYHFQYPTEVSFVADTLPYSLIEDKKEVRNIVIVNTSAEPVDIGYWKIQSEAENYEFRESLVLKPGETYAVSRLAYAGNGAISLRAPDDEERDVVSIVGPLPQVKQKNLGRTYAPASSYAAPSRTQVEQIPEQPSLINPENTTENTESAQETAKPAQQEEVLPVSDMSQNEPLSETLKTSLSES